MRSNRAAARNDRRPPRPRVSHSQRRGQQQVLQLGEAELFFGEEINVEEVKRRSEGVRPFEDEVSRRVFA